MNRRNSYVAIGVVLAACGALMPQSWYSPLPQREALPAPPISGFLLLRLSFLIEGAIVVWVGSRRRRFMRIEPRDRASIPLQANGYLGLWRDRWLLGAILLVGLGLRLVSLGSDLWLDEISPLFDYRDASPWQIVTSYISSNNHLLNTLLVNASTTLFGEREWAIRLPAMLFGVATIPLLYLIARQITSRRASIGAAMLLAVSYHHVFFSQDARGYTAYIFFSLLASLLFVSALSEDRPWLWACYVVATTLNLASLLVSGFVLAAHAAVGALVLLSIRRAGGSTEPMFKRLLGVFLVSALLGFQMYAAAIPHIYVYMRTIYAHPSAGFTPLSGEFLSEVARGLSVGFRGRLLGVGVFLGVGAIGFVSLLRRNWPLVSALALPGIFQISFCVARGLVVSPRYFLLALPVSILGVVQGIEDLARYAATRVPKVPSFERLLAAALVLFVASLSASALPRYYRVPKQAYREAIAYVQSERTPRTTVIVIYLAEWGYRYYASRLQLRQGRDYFCVRSVHALDEVLARHPGETSLLITTFPRALRIARPDLDRRIRRYWRALREFPGTVGDGEITVWKQIR